MKRVGEQKLLLPHKPCYGMGKCSSLQSRGDGEGQNSAAAAPRSDAAASTAAAERQTQHRAPCPEEPRAVGSQTAGLEPCRSTLPWVLEALGSQ